MLDLFSLVKCSSAYKIIEKQKETDAFSHAYYIEHGDKEYLKDYLKIIAELILSKKCDDIYNARIKNLIDGENYPDVLFFPKNGTEIKTDDINAIIEESYIKPIENEKKIFVISNAENMNTSAQNKLLKTLEEPPKNVIILIGATNGFTLLPTVKSRLNKLSISPFSDEVLFKALKEDFVNEQKLKEAIACADGTVGKVVSLYNNEKLHGLIELAKDMLINMQSSKNVLSFSMKIQATKEVSEFISVCELLLRDLLCYYEGKEELVKNKTVIQETKYAKGFSVGAIVYALEKLNEAEKRSYFHSNPTVLVEYMLFQILEGKYKWQK